MVKFCKFRVSIVPQAIIVLAGLLLTIPVKWICAWLMAAIVHELFHCIGILLCGGKIYSVHIDACGAKIRASTLSAGKQIICLLAGPVGALNLCILSEHLPRLAVCVIMQSGYNLLPFPSLDGGHALMVILQLFLSDHIARKICSTIRYVTLTAFFIVGIYSCMVWKLGIFPIIFALILLLRHGEIKIPCNQWLHRVQ